MSGHPQFFDESSAVLPLDWATCVRCGDALNDTYVDLPRSALDSFRLGCELQIDLDLDLDIDWTNTNIHEYVQPATNCLRTDTTVTEENALETVSFSVTANLADLADRLPLTWFYDMAWQFKFAFESVEPETVSLHATSDLTGTVEACFGATCTPRADESEDDTTDEDITLFPMPGIADGFAAVARICRVDGQFKLALAFRLNAAFISSAGIAPISRIFIYTGDWTEWASIFGAAATAGVNQTLTSEESAGTVFGIGFNWRAVTTTADVDLHTSSGTHPTCALIGTGPQYFETDRTGHVNLGCSSVAISEP